MVHAHRGEIYAAVYERATEGPSEILAPFHALPAEAAARIREAAGERELLAVGDGYRRFEEVLTPALGRCEVGGDELDLPPAEAVAREGLKRFRAQGPDDTAALEPLYVRPSDAKLPAVPLEV
jgi:tRNA A37 threonylcarbamoyladenosine modification protein TsaB